MDFSNFLNKAIETLKPILNTGEKIIREQVNDAERKINDARKEIELFKRKNEGLSTVQLKDKLLISKGNESIAIKLLIKEKMNNSRN